jgi:hypothetical protein
MIDFQKIYFFLLSFDFERSSTPVPPLPFCPKRNEKKKKKKKKGIKIWVNPNPLAFLCGMTMETSLAGVKDSRSAK